MPLTNVMNGFVRTAGMFFFPLSTPFTRYDLLAGWYLRSVDESQTARNVHAVSVVFATATMPQ